LIFASRPLSGHIVTVRQGADWDRSGTGLEKGSKVQGFQGSKVQGFSGQLSVFFFPRANASKFYRKSRQRAVSLGCLAREYTDGIPVKPLNESIKTALSECSFRRPCIHG
jgi:hypothetical protein